MSSLATAAALIAIAAAAVIYGTDIFSALVLRPAAAVPRHQNPRRLETGETREPVRIVSQVR